MGLSQLARISSVTIMSEWNESTWAGVSVWELSEGLSQDEIHTDEFQDTWNESIQNNSISMIVFHMDIQESFRFETFDLLKEMMKTARENGIKGVAISSSNNKRLSVSGQLKQVEGIQVYGARKKSGALSWANSRSQ